MKKLRKLTAVLCFCIFLINALTGCSSNAKVKTFAKDSFSVTMDNSFEEKDLIDTTYYLESPKAFLVVKKELFEDLEAIGITAESGVADYAKTVIENSGLSDSDANLSDNKAYAYFTYIKKISGVDYFYYAVALKSGDSFWLCQFGCINSVKDEYIILFQNWAKTIQIS